MTWRESYNFMNFSIPTIIIQNLDIKDFLNKHRKFLTFDQLSDMTLSLNLPRILYETMFYKVYKEYYIQLYEVFPKLDWEIIYTFYKFIKDEKCEYHGENDNAYNNFIEHIISTNKMDKILSIIKKDIEILTGLKMCIHILDLIISKLLKVKSLLE